MSISFRVDFAVTTIVRHEANILILATHQSSVIPNTKTTAKTNASTEVAGLTYCTRLLADDLHISRPPHCWPHISKNSFESTTTAKTKNRSGRIRADIIAAGNYAGAPFSPPH